MVIDYLDLNKCQKVYNRALPLSTAKMMTVISDLILNLDSLLIWISVFFLFSSHLLFFNLISLECSGQWNEILPTKKEKKITLFFSLSVRPCSHRPCNSGRKEILATYFFAEELFVSLISVINFKVERRGPSGMRLWLLQIEHKTVIQSCYKLGKYYSMLQKTAIGQWPQTNNSDLETKKRFVCVCVCVCVCMYRCVCV